MKGDEMVWIVLVAAAALNVLASCFVVRAAKTNRRTTELLTELIQGRD